MFAFALLLAGASVALSVTSRTTNTATTTTVTADPPPPAFSPDQIATAKKEVCDASINADKSITGAQRHFFDAARDRQSPEYRAALGNYQIVVSIETAYLERHIAPAVPKDVKDATNGYMRATRPLTTNSSRQV
jgi:hypothetical protein